MTAFLSYEYERVKTIKSKRRPEHSAGRKDCWWIRKGFLRVYWRADLSSPRCVRWPCAGSPSCCRVCSGYCQAAHPVINPTSNRLLYFKGTQAWKNFEFFFWPKSNPYMPLVNFEKNFSSFPSIFARISMIEHFCGDWAYAEPNFFLWDIQKKLFLQNLHFGPIR